MKNVRKLCILETGMGSERIVPWALTKFAVTWSSFLVGKCILVIVRKHTVLKGTVSPTMNVETLHPHANGCTRLT